jgi:hypothetical protein
MKNENEKKGLFNQLTNQKKTKKNSCCGNFTIEEIPENNKEKNKKKSPKDKNGSCC